MNELTTSQTRRRKHLETEIQQSANTMGTNLKTIHDEGLYLSTHATWEGYCSGVWGMSKRRASQLIQHGKMLLLLAEDDPVNSVVDETGTIVPDDDPSYQTDTLNPQNEPETAESEPTEPDPVAMEVPEAATRKLAGLPEGVQKTILQAAITETEDAGRTAVTAKVVGKHVDAWKAENEPEVAEPTIDNAITSHNQVIGAMSRDLGKVATTANEYGKTNGWLDPNRLQELTGRIKSAKATLNSVKSVGPCPYCGSDGCEKCRQTGYVNKTTNDAAPE